MNDVAALVNICVLEPFANVDLASSFVCLCKDTMAVDQTNRIFHSSAEGRGKCDETVTIVAISGDILIWGAWALY